MMRLFVPTMDSVVVEFDAHGRVRFEQDPGWSAPSVQERRAIIHAAKDEIASLNELLDVLENQS